MLVLVIPQQIKLKLAKTLVWLCMIVRTLMKRSLPLPHLSVLYDDEHLVVVDKPSGMLSVPGKIKKGSYVQPRHQQWLTVINNAADRSNELFEGFNGKNVLIDVMNKMKNVESIPRKEKLFTAYVKRMYKINDDEITANIWKVLTEIDESLHKRDLEDVPTELISASEIIASICNIKTVYNVHRLDMDTSGLLVFAKNAEICNLLGQQFRDREIDKVYLAKVNGIVTTDDKKSLTINVPIRPDISNRPMQVIDYDNGKSSETIVEPLMFNNNNNENKNNNNNAYTIVKLIPVTGRTHQLRLHMLSLGHPILGDTLYAPEEIIKKSDRLCLHAYSLSFTHPITNKLMNFKSLETCNFCSDCDL